MEERYTKRELQDKAMENWEQAKKQIEADMQRAENRERRIAQLGKLWWALFQWVFVPLFVASTVGLFFMEIARLAKLG